MEGGVTATTDLSTWTVEIHLLSSPSAVQSVFKSRLRSDRRVCRRLWGIRADINRSIPSSPLQLQGTTASAASSWMSTLPEETMTVRLMLTKEKPYCTEILQAVHTSIVLHSAYTSHRFPPCDWFRSTSPSTTLLYIYCARKEVALMQHQAQKWKHRQQNWLKLWGLNKVHNTNNTSSIRNLLYSIYFCSQPSKGGSQWSSSTLLQTEVNLALEWDWKTTIEEVQSLGSAASKCVTWTQFMHNNNNPFHVWSTI